MKAFLAALAVGVFTLVVGASAATSAPSREHLLVGYNHAPTAADRAAIASVGGMSLGGGDISQAEEALYNQIRKTAR